MEDSNAGEITHVTNVPGIVSEVHAQIQELRDMISKARIDNTFRKQIYADKDLTSEELDLKYNPDGTGEHPVLTRSTWRNEVVMEHTQDGYWSWVKTTIDDAHSQIDKIYGYHENAEETVSNSG